MSVPGVRFSVRVNNDLSFAELLALAEAAERAGFDQLWVSNDLFLRSAPVLAGALAARTGRIGLGIAVMNPYSVHVSELAMVAATVQEVSGGRFLLGLGAGAEQFLGWAGIARTRPLATTRTALAVLRTLLGHRDVDAACCRPGSGPDSVLRFPRAAAGAGLHRRDGPEDARDGGPARGRRAAAALPARTLRRGAAAGPGGRGGCARPARGRPARLLLGLAVRRPGRGPGRAGREAGLLRPVDPGGGARPGRAAAAGLRARPPRWPTAGRRRPGSSTTACWPWAWPGTRPTCWPAAARCDGSARGTCRSARRWDRTRWRRSACWARRCCPP